ncbi:hypothetical protein OURE66S_00344 [Oligella ureolytica]
MDTQQETFAVPNTHLVDGLASTRVDFPVSISTAANLSTQTTGLLLGLLLLLIGCLA